MVFRGLGRGEKESIHPDFVKIGVDGAIKSHGKREGLPWLKSKENLLFPQIIYSSIYPE